MNIRQWSDEEVRTTLMQVAEHPVDVVALPTSRFTLAPSGRYKLNPDQPMFRYFRSVFSWVPLNPNNEANRDAINESFIVMAELEHDQPALPSEGGLQKLFSVLSHLTPSTIFIVGKRGCGKTACINYFLNKYHSQLNEIGMTWFRTDMSKLYSPRGDNERGFTANEYQRAHCLFIALKYAQEDKLLNPFRLASDGSATSCDFYANELSKTQFRSLADIWERVVLAFHVHAASSMAFVEHVINEFDRSKSAREGDYRLLFSLAMQAITKNRLQKSGRLIQVLDGIDNIDRIEGHDTYYNFLHQINAQVNGTEKPKSFTKTIVVLREETLRDLDALNSQSAGYADHVKSRAIFQVLPASPTNIVNHKHPIVKEPKSSYFRDRRREAMSTNQYEVFWDGPLKDFAVVYFDVLAEICGVGTQISDRSMAVLEKLFNNNLRSMCMNLIGTYRYVRTYVMRTKRLTADHDQLDAALKQVLKIQRYIVLEGSITAGDPMLSTALEARDESAWCPNLFDFPLDDDANRWEGLCLYRALQLLEVTKDAGESQKRLQEHLKKMEYTESSARCALSLGWRFGLWEVVDSSNPDFGKSPIIKLTEKGKFLLHVAFESPAITYFMATATRFHLEHFNNTKMWQLHNPRPDEKRRFVPSMVKTSLTLIRYIASAHKHEVDNKLLPSSIARLTAPTANLEHWRNTLVSYIDGYYRLNRYESEQLLLDLDGLLA